MVSQAKEKEKTKAEETPKKTLDSVEAVSLTDHEKTNLSRDMILGWYRAKRYEKLKALLSSSSSEKNAMKEGVVTKTIQELEKLNKDLTMDERKKIAEKFSDEFFNADNSKEFEKVIAKLNKEAAEEQMFFVYMGTFGGIRGIHQLRKLKEKKEIAAAFKRKPGLEKKFDEAAETGDFAKVREVLTEEVPEMKNLKKEEVDLMLILYSESQGPFSEMLGKVPAIGQWLKQGLDWMKRTKEMINYGFFQKAAKKLDVDTVNLMNVAHITVFELEHRNEVMQKYKHLLVAIKDRTKDQKTQKKLERDLKYIDDVKKVYDSVQGAMNEPKTYGLIKAGLKKRLDKEKKLSEADKQKILAEFEGYSLESQGEKEGQKPKAKYMSLRVHTFLPLVVYGPKGERDNDSNIYWGAVLATRYKRIRKGLDFMSSQYSYSKANAWAGLHRAGAGIANEATRFWNVIAGTPNEPRYKTQLKGLKDLAGFEKEIKAIEGELGKYTFSNADELSTSNKDFLRDMKHHDEMLRKYYALSTQMSHWLTEQGRSLVNAEKELRRLGILDGKATGIKQISKETLEALGVTGKKTLNPTIINDAYFSKLEQLHSIRDAAQNRFANLSQNVCAKVITPFEENWMKRIRQEDLTKLVKDGQEDLKRFIKPSSRIAYYTKALALPGIAVGVPVFDAIRGKSKMRDVKWDVFDAAIGFVPVAGTLNDFKMWWTEKTTSGRKLSFKERWTAFSFGCLGALSDAAWVLGGLGGAMRVGIGGLRAAKVTAKVGRLSRIGDSVREAEKLSWSRQKFADVAQWLGRRKIAKVEKQEGRSYQALIEEERQIKLALDEARKAVKTPEIATEIAAKEAELLKVTGNLAPFLDAEAKFAIAGEKFAKRGLAFNTIWKGGAIAAGGVAAYALLGTNPGAKKTRDDAVKLAVYGAGKGYDAAAWTLDKAASTESGPPEFEDIVDQYVKDRKQEADFNGLLGEIEKTDATDKKEKIEEVCAENWFNPHVQSWAYQNKDKLDLKKIMELAKKKITKPMEMLQGKMAGSIPGGAAAMDIAKGDATHGKKAGEGISE